SHIARLGRHQREADSGAEKTRSLVKHSASVADGVAVRVEPRQLLHSSHEPASAASGEAAESHLPPLQAALRRARCELTVAREFLRPRRVPGLPEALQGLPSAARTDAVERTRPRCLPILSQLNAPFFFAAGPMRV